MVGSGPLPVIHFPIPEGVSTVSETDGFTPRTELAQRAQHLRVHLSDLGLDGALIVQKADLFYFSGSIQQAHLYIPVDGDPLLMVRKSVDRARAESAIDKVIPVDSPARLPAILRDNGLRPPRRMGMELDVLPANLFLAYGNIFDTTRIVDVSPAIRTVRSVKSDVEIRQIRKAAECADRVAGAVGGCLAEGMTEIQLAGRIEAVARALGHQGIVRMRLWGNELFYGHLMSGASGAEPSYLASPTGGTGLGPAVAQGPGFKRIRRHEPVLVDYVFAHQGYLADHTRIFSSGCASRRLDGGAPGDAGRSGADPGGGPARRPGLGPV